MLFAQNHVIAPDALHLKGKQIMWQRIDQLPNLFISIFATHLEYAI